MLDILLGLCYSILIIIRKKKKMNTHQHRNSHGVFGRTHSLLAKHSNPATQIDHEYTLAYENLMRLKIESLKAKENLFILQKI